MCRMWYTAHMTCRDAPAITEITLPADDRAPSRARRFVANAARDCLQSLVEDATLMVSELVSNVVRHSRHRDFRLRVGTTEDGTLRVEVVDPGRGFRPRFRNAEAERASGWGLEIVDRLSTRWGVMGRRPTTVWFELAAQ